MKSVISPTEASLEKPAACLWPPPPLFRARLVEVGALEVRDDDAATVEDGSVLERSSYELQLRKGDVFVDALEHSVDVGARLDELGGEAESLRRGVRVLEAARVRDDRDVERFGDLGRQLDPELAKKVAEDLARRGSGA